MRSSSASFAAWVALSFSLACAHPTLEVALDPARLARATAAATGFLEVDANVVPAAYLVMHALHRWFALEAFAGMPWRYHQAIGKAVARGDSIPWSSDLHPSYLRVFRRLAFAQQIDTGGKRTWEEFAPAMLERGGINVINVPALYCDQLDYPKNYATILEKSVEAGGYELTHVGQALKWIEENGCEAPVEDAGFTRRVADAIDALPNEDARVLDLEIEAVAFSFYLGRERSVRPRFVEALLNAQRADGGWTVDSGDPSLSSNWHPTVLALWVLLELRDPGLSTGVWVPQRG